MSGRVARRLSQLNKFNIVVVNPRELRSQAMSDLLTKFSSGEYKVLHVDLYYEEI